MKLTTPPKLIPPFHSTAASRWWPSSASSARSATDGRPVGVLGLADQPAAAAVAAAVGISDVRAGLLPEAKVAAVERLQSGGARLAVVGDGVNNAPALASAHVGVAMGRHGSDLALKTPDVVMVQDQLAALPADIDLSRHARPVVTANLAFRSPPLSSRPWSLSTWPAISRSPSASPGTRDPPW